MTCDAHDVDNLSRKPGDYFWTCVDCGQRFTNWMTRMEEEAARRKAAARKPLKRIKPTVLMVCPDGTHAGVSIDGRFVISPGHYRRIMQDEFAIEVDWAEYEHVPCGCCDRGGD